MIKLLYQDFENLGNFVNSLGLKLLRMFFLRRTTKQIHVACDKQPLHELPIISFRMTTPHCVFMEPPHEQIHHMLPGFRRRFCEIDQVMEDALHVPPFWSDVLVSSSYRRYTLSYWHLTLHQRATGTSEEHCDSNSGLRCRLCHPASVLWVSRSS